MSGIVPLEGARHGECGRLRSSQATKAGGPEVVGHLGRIRAMIANIQRTVSLPIGFLVSLSRRVSQYSPQRSSRRRWRPALDAISKAMSAPPASGYFTSSARNIIARRSSIHYAGNVGFVLRRRRAKPDGGGPIGEAISLIRALVAEMARASSKKPSDTPPPDPMPSRVDPCLAMLVDRPPQGPDWAYEVKWDGYRIAVHIEPHRVRLITRGGTTGPPAFRRLQLRRYNSD